MRYINLHLHYITLHQLQFFLHLYEYMHVRLIYWSLSDHSVEFHKALINSFDYSVNRQTGRHG